MRAATAACKGQAEGETLFRPGDRNAFTTLLGHLGRIFSSSLTLVPQAVLGCLR